MANIVNIYNRQVYQHNSRRSLLGTYQYNRKKNENNDYFLITPRIEYGRFNLLW